ncbi:MAG: hypothetical protein ACKO50_07190 [Cyanobium sp.]
MTDHLLKRRKKMIEVAITLEAIHAASAREKSILGGLPGGRSPAAQALKAAGGGGLVRHHDGVSHSASLV